MTNTYVWTQAVSADWTAATDWSGGVSPNDPANDLVLLNAVGNYTVTISAGESFSIRGLAASAGTLSLQASAALSIAGASTLGPGGVIDGGGALVGGGSLTSGGLIAGTVPGSDLQIGMAGFTNTGTVQAASAGLLIFSPGFSNLSGNTLTGGVYEADGPAFGSVSAILINVGAGTASEVVTDSATITLNGDATAFASYNGSNYVNLEYTLTSITAAGVLNLIGGRDYFGNQAIANAGTITFGGGEFSANGLTSSGMIRGFGTIDPGIASTGTIVADGGILTVAGVVADTGALVVDPNAVLALTGSFARPVADNGALQAEGGLLKLAGPVDGSGGFIIDSPTLSAGGTLELATATAGQVAFNGPQGVLRLDTPGSFTGTIVGFGQGDFSGRAGDTIDLSGIVADSATLAGSTLQIEHNGSIVDTLTLAGDYTGLGIAFSATRDGAGGTAITVSGANARDYALEGPYWHSMTITWSFAASNLPGEQGPAFSDFLTAGTLPGDTRDQTQYQSIVRQALAEWSGIGGFNFVQVADSAQSDLRIGWGNFASNGGEIGQSDYGFQSDTMLADSIIRLQDPTQVALDANAADIGGLVYHGTSSSLYQVALHEIGHALGLGHSTDLNAVMYPSAGGAQNQSPDASDIAGIMARYAAIACFAAGTRIATVRGAVAVEALRPGDVVHGLVSDRPRRVRWIGHRRLDPSRHPCPHDVMPVRIAAHAFGLGLPHRDVRLSPDHAVLFRGALIPVRYLINGASIRQERVRAIAYFHVELEDSDGRSVHDAISADGLPVESYLDTGNRGDFENGGGAIRLHAAFARRAWATQSCAPLVLRGSRLVRAKRHLLAQATKLGHALTGSPDLRAMADDRELAAEADGRRWRVRLPEAAAHLRLLSRAWTPEHTRPGERDARRLGVAIARLWLDGRAVSLESPGLCAGWHAPETGWRWTDGDAVLAVAGVREVAFEVAMTGTYWRDATPGAARAA